MKKLLLGDCMDRLADIPDASVHCCVTSPPYWGLRDYGQAGQIGLEETPDAYVVRLVEVFREVRRVLRDDGTLWLNLGDSYAAGKLGRDDNTGADLARRASHYGSGTGEGRGPQGGKSRSAPPGLKPKDLVGIPWRVAFALQSDGWWLRQDIVWHKLNPMPESVTDRCTKAHEYVFLLTKSQRYYYDAEAVKEVSTGHGGLHTFGAKGNINRNDGERAVHRDDMPTRNRRSVWTIATKPYGDAHFAVMPEDLVQPCILAGTSQEGCCPACGTPWERVVEKPDCTTGWRSGCECGGDWRVVESPTGQVEADDPTMQTGRAGMNRPRRDGEGTRPMYRWEQKTYAAQLRASPNRVDMQNEAGPAFAHYIRTDDSGARPVPAVLLNKWLAAGWLTKPVPPDRKLSPVPCTVLDPFSGAGTVGVVANKLNRQYIGIELNPDYMALAEARLATVNPLLAYDKPEPLPNVLSVQLSLLETTT